MIHRSNKDTDRNCCKVLTSICTPGDPDEHVGQDIFDHFHDLKGCQLSQWTLWQKISRILTMPALPVMWCERHQEYCVFRTCDIDISGFPCVDYSPSGGQRGIEGSTFPVLLALISWHRQRRTRIVLLENVPEFNIEILKSLASDLYEILPFFVEPSDAGCEYLSRMRVFILMYLRGQISKTIRNYRGCYTT